MFEELGSSEYRYVVVEGAPLLGPVDGQLVARWADAVLVVCRLDRLSPSDATELGDVVSPARGAGARRRADRRLERALLAAGLDARRDGLPTLHDASGPSSAERIPAAQMSPASSHRWRQCSVSMNALLASRPHQAPSSAAEPIP